MKGMLLYRLIEDCVRDLLLNNDHIHVVEQQMRHAIKLGLQVPWLVYSHYFPRSDRPV